MKKNISTSAKTNTSTSNVELEEKAISKFRSGQYKEAIECYKSLLKQTNNPEWREKLSVCYLRRSLALAEKGMTKEAAVFWENYTQNATPPFQSLDSYIIWQLQNNSSKIESCLRQLSCKQVDEEYPELAVLLGLLMLTDKPNLAKFLPPESQLLIHLDIANSAIEAYRNNEITGIEAALAKLPFRSAFRDFRTLLKAYLLPDSMQAQKLETLAKIPVTSLYHGISNLLYMLELQGSEVVKRLMTLPPKQRKLITSIKGFSKKQEELLAQIGLHHSNSHYDEKPILLEILAGEQFYFLAY